MFDNLRRVSRQSVLYGTADAAVLVVNVVLLPVYTRVLQPAEYGALAMLIVLEAILKPALRCGMDHAYVRLYYDCQTEDQRRGLARTALAFVVASNGLVLALLWPGSRWLTPALMGDLRYQFPLQLVVLNTCLQNLTFLPLSLFRVQERSTVVGSLTFARSAGTVVARLAFVVGLRMGVLGLALADLVMTVLLLAGLLPTQLRMIRGRFSWPVLRSLLKYGFPQVPLGLLAQAMSTADRYMLEMYFSLREVGLYLFGNTMATLLKLYPAALETAWSPFAFSSLHRPDAPRLFARMASYAFTGLCFGALGVSLFADPVARLVLPPSYHDATVVVPLLALGIAIQASGWFMTTSINVAKRTSRYPFATAVGAVASLSGTFVLTPVFGMMGAAAGVVFGQTMLFLALAWFSQRSYPIPYEVGRLAKVATTAAVLFGAGTFLRAPSPWSNIAVATAMVAAYPVVLLAIGFLQPWETREIRQALAAHPLGRRLFGSYRAPQA